MAGFKRKVFYVGGFDPRGVRFYHQLLDEQIARYAALTGEAVTLSTRKSVSPIRSDWTVRNDTLDATTDYTFLRWEDIVRDAWVKNPFSLAFRAFRSYRDNVRYLDFPTGKTLGKGPLITLFYPPVFMILLPLLAALPIGSIAAIWLPWWAALLIGVVAGVALARPFLIRMHAPWLLRFFVFNSELGGGEANPALEKRLDDFAAEILASFTGEWDEILLITHSNGSILGVPLMQRLLERAEGPLPANFALVTLGHCIPLVACRRDAVRFKAQLAFLAGRDFRWIDIGSPPDGAAYFGVNPMLLVVPDARPRMELLSPRFYLFYNPDTYHKGYHNKYEVHFDYLRTGDRVSEIDYPSLMAKPRSIERAIVDFRANH